MRVVATLLSITLAVSLVCGAQPPDGFLLKRQTVIDDARDVTRIRYPNADRVLVANHVLERYETNGTSVVWDDEYVKVLTEKGRRDAATLKLPFSTHYGTAGVWRAEIIKPDGEVIPCDTEAYTRVMIDTGQMQANIYDPANKMLTLSLPGVEINDICHLVSCRLTTKARMPGAWADHALFEYDSPIVKLDHTILAPAGLPVRHSIMRAPIAGTVTNVTLRLPDGGMRHVWQARQVPQMFPEPDMPPLHTQVQRLLLSTIPDWPTVSRWYWELCQPALSATNAAMYAQVQALTARAATRGEKIRALFTFVSQQIRYMGITPEATAPGYEPHPVSLTFNNRYGVCRDKAALLVSLLNIAGIPAYPVLIHAGARMDPEVPLPFFNHAVTAVAQPDGGYLLMDPTDETTRDLFPAYLCNRSYLVARPEGESLRVSDAYPAEKNLTKIVSDGTLDDNGTLLLTTDICFEGINDNAYRGHLMRRKGEDRRRFFEHVIKHRLPGATLLSCEIAPADLQDTSVPLQVTLVSRTPDFPVRGDGVDLLPMPWLATTIGYVNFVVGRTGLIERHYPMDTGVTCGARERVTLRLGRAMGPARTLPAPVRIDRAGVRFDLTQQVTNQVLHGSLTYLLNTPEFSPEAYRHLRETLAEIEAAGRKRPLFVGKAPPTPDQEILSDATETRLHTPQAWTTTRTWSKRILTYAGKKNHAELKFDYNPAWQHLELVAATVSNLTGQIHQVAPREINLMDADWVGAAPRYPAAKTLVVNLPGVETGSVITVTTRFTQTNAFFYSHTHLFGGLHPVHSERYSLTLPAGLTPSVRVYHGDALTAVTTTNQGMVTLSWQTDALPAIRQEEQMPPWHFHQPTLFVSLGEWKTHARALRLAIRNVAREHLRARHRAKQLVRGVRDPRDRLLRIRNEVLRTIRPVKLLFPDIPPTALSTPDQTLADQYGHPLDRAILLHAMLDAVGFDPEILFASSDTTRYERFSAPQREIPQNGYFIHPLVTVRCQGTTVYLNEGDQYDELGVSALDGAPALSLRGKIAPVALAERFQDLHEEAWTVELDHTGTATITVTNRFFGTQAGPMRKRYSEMLPETLRRHHQELIGEIAKSARAASDLQVVTDTYPCVRVFTVTAPHYAALEQDTLTLHLPAIAGALFPLRDDTRDHPLFLARNARARLICRVILPQGFTRLPLLPQARQWVLPKGLGTLHDDVRTRQRADGRLMVDMRRTREQQSAAVPAECYPALLEYNRRLTHPAGRTVVAQRPEPRGNKETE